MRRKIVGFKHKGLRQLYEHGDRRGINPEHVARIEEILTALDVAHSPYDMSLPSYRLHALSGDLKGFWAVTVRAH